MALIKAEHRALRIAAVALALLVAVGVSAGKNTVTVGGIDFRGLSLLGKYEIMSGAGVTRSGRGLVVDLDGLNAYLSKEPLVAAYDIRQKGDSLVVTVAEKVPAYVIAAVRGEETILFEVDAGLNTVSVGKVHALGRPLVIINRADAAGGFSPRIKKLLASLGVLRENNSRLYRELSTLDLRFYPEAVMSLRGRETRFHLDVKDLAAGPLEALVGYVDRQGGRTRRVEYHGDFAVMK